MRYNFLRYPGGKTKAVTLSYDDGSASDIRFLEKINEYGLKCTFNLIGAAVEDEAGLTKEFIVENILGKGHEIANHGYEHRGVDVIRPIEGIRDTLDSRLSLEKQFGMIIRGMAYADRCINRFKKPDTYKIVKNYLQELDIVYSRTAGADNDVFELPEDFLNWMPNVKHTNPEVFDYIDKFLGIDFDKLYIASRTPKLFYMWGHSFEFDGDNNWELLDEICKKLSGKDDIWYATNMEIYEYVNAYKSLVYSADGKTIYNPTLFDIWFDVDGKLYCIKSGETVKI